MGSVAVDQLHLLFFPFMAHGHLIPAVDAARLFTMRGVKVTIVTTPLNAAHVSQIVGREIQIHQIRFPSVEAGLPEGCENASSITDPDMKGKFLKAADMLQQPFEEILQKHHPDCIVSDVFFPWTTDVAVKFGIPRIIFHGTSFFSMCAQDSLSRCNPHANITSDTEAFFLPGFPDQIEMTRSQLPDELKDPNNISGFHKKIRESYGSCYGALVNSFYELEPAYAEQYRKAMGRKAWHIGPVSLSNKNFTEKAQRGNKAAIDAHECFRWLDSKEPDSVLFVCFGSMARFSSVQLREIAMGLEDSGHPFFWAVRKTEKSDEEEPWVPDGLEERMGGNCLIIRGWAPQVLILDHPAVGGFVTHCGWNSILESVSSGVPMITWPLFAEQFLNEKVVTVVLRIGVGVGIKTWTSPFAGKGKQLVKGDALREAITRLMDGGEEAKKMRSRARELKEFARRAVEKGGSSYADLTALIKDLKLHKQSASRSRLSHVWFSYPFPFYPKL